MSKTVSNWKIVFLDPLQIFPNPFFARSNLDDTIDEVFIEDAVKDLKQPVIVRPKGEGYELAFGHRRWMAFKAKGVKIPCIIRELSDEEMIDYAWDDVFHFEAHEPEDEARLILKRLDFKLRHAPKEYAKYGNDPLNVLKAMNAEQFSKYIKSREFSAPRGAEKSAKGRPAGTTKYPLPVPEVLVKIVETVFSELPAKRRIDWRTFLMHRLPLLEIPDEVKEELDSKEVRGSTRAKEAIAKVEDPDARRCLLEWAKEKPKVRVRDLDKRASVLNKVKDELEKAPEQEKEKLIDLILEKCPHPRQIKLEVERLKASETPSTIVDEDVKIYFKSCEDMSELGDGSVALIITSPPYWNKVEFNDVLSKAKTADEFFALMDPIVEECARVLMPSGKFALNWGEPIGEGKGENYYEEVYVHRWIELFKKHGLKLYAKIIWHKNPFYAIAMDRVRYDDAVKADAKVHLNWEWLLIFRKDGPTREGNTGITYEEWKNWTDAVWYIQAAQSVRNLAVFPDELVERIIKLYSFPGDIVLDPFAGTGTTLSVAKKLGRKAVGYEINKELQPIIQQKLVS